MHAADIDVTSCTHVVAINKAVARTDARVMQPRSVLHRHRAAVWCQRHIRSSDNERVDGGHHQGQCGECYHKQIHLETRDLFNSLETRTSISIPS
jgi:hypothetical protein